MAKEQVNVRVSEYIRWKLDALTARHGTQTEAVAIAIERLFAAEFPDGAGLYEMARDRVQRDRLLTEYSDVLFADWPSGETHWLWIIRSSVGTIIDWSHARRANINNYAKR